MMILTATNRAIAVIAAAVVLAGLRMTTPSFQTLTDPIPVSGEPSQLVATPQFEVEGGPAVLAESVQYSDPIGGRTVVRDTAGVWLVVPARVRAIDRTTTLTRAEWRTGDGRRFAASPRAGEASDNLLGKQAHPGISGRWRRLAFELPAGSDGQGELVAAASHQPLSAEVRIRYRAAKTPPVATVDLDQPQ